MQSWIPGPAGRISLAACVLWLLASTALAATRKEAAPIVPNATEIAVYVPPSQMKMRNYLSSINLWVEPGKAIADALDEVGKRYFPTLHVLPSTQDAPAAYGLLLDLAPKWSIESGKPQLTIAYEARSPDGQSRLSGNIVQAATVRGNNFNAAAQSAATLAVGRVMADVQKRLAPTPSMFPATGSTAKIDYATLVDRSKPTTTGTAFFINASGQLLTAAHVMRDCMAMDAHQDGATFPVTTRASSALLDVAVLDSARARAGGIPLRQDDQLVLGEGVTSVGYPLSGLLGDSPNLTRGNISASKGLRGSMGMFQFSAPIQPGNSGGPIVSDNGELLGMAVSTLNAEALVRLGHIPQNINFGLDARYVAMFLQRENVAFARIAPKGVGSMQTANQAALSNTVQLNCYQ